MIINAIIHVGPGTRLDLRKYSHCTFIGIHGKKRKDIKLMIPDRENCAFYDERDLEHLIKFGLYDIVYQDDLVEGSLPISVDIPENNHIADNWSIGAIQKEKK